MQAVFQVARSGLVALGFVWPLVPLRPLTARATEAIDWLHRAASAAQRLNYTGTILYQHGTRIETSRIIHYVDPTGEYEKLVNLDGPPREVIRNNEQITCYLPDSKLVRIESRASRTVVSVAAAEPDRDARPELHHAAVGAIARSPGATRSRSSWSRATGCATATCSGPTRKPASC